MADLGAIGKLYPGLRMQVYYSFPVAQYAAQTIVSGKWFTMLRQDGTFAGNVKTTGVNTPNVDVFVMWRPNMKVIAHTRTDANGNWELAGFDPTQTANYAVIYRDPETGEAFNDAIYALVAPVAP